MMYVNPIGEPHLREFDAVSLEALRRNQAFEDLEHLFIFALMKEMRKSINESGLFPHDASLDFYEEMLDDALSRNMAQSGQFGIAKMMEEQLRIQEMQKEIQREMKTDSTQQVKAQGEIADKP